MQRRNFAFLTILITFLAVASWAADITGTWTGAMAGGGFSLTYTFKQEGAKLTGTVIGPQGDPMPLVDCKIDGDKISFAVKVDMGGNAATFSSTGVIKGEEIVLKTTNDAGLDFGGEMTLKRSK